MKYIKAFENDEFIDDKYKDYTPIFHPKYNKGDYILIDIKKLRAEYPIGIYDAIFPYYKNYGKIIAEPRQIFIDSFMYDVKAINTETLTLQEIQECYISESKIIRKLKDKEIKDFELTLLQNKYNL
jgi:hypothetical protein